MYQWQFRDKLIGPLKINSIFQNMINSIPTSVGKYGDMESDMCDVIKIYLNPSLFQGFPCPLLLSSSLFRRIFMTSHMTLPVSLGNIMNKYLAKHFFFHRYVAKKINSNYMDIKCKMFNNLMKKGITYCNENLL